MAVYELAHTGTSDKEQRRRRVEDDPWRLQLQWSEMRIKYGHDRRQGPEVKVDWLLTNRCDVTRTWVRTSKG